MKHIAAMCAVFAVLLTGCATTQETVMVPLPVYCQIAEPARPAMPTDALPARPVLDAFVQAALAEIELREGYEGELRAALAGCKETSNKDSHGFH